MNVIGIRTIHRSPPRPKYRPLRNRTRHWVALGAKGGSAPQQFRLLRRALRFVIYTRGYIDNGGTFRCWRCTQSRPVMRWTGVSIILPLPPQREHGRVSDIIPNILRCTLPDRFRDNRGRSWEPERPALCRARDSCHRLCTVYLNLVRQTL